MRLITLLSLAMVSSLTAWAQTRVQVKQENARQLPIELRADHAVYDANEDIATYTGNVEITQGKMLLKGEKVVITLKDGEVTRIESWGDLAYFHYVPPAKPPIDGKGRYMIYRVGPQILDIDGEAWIKQEDNVTNAEHLTYYLQKERVQGRRIDMTLIPKTR